MPRQSDGLSPLARGTPNIIQGINNYRRFIPAGSGNTQRSQTPEMEIPVYPRWRGEHPMDPTFAVCVTGLSPLARGTPIGAARQQTQARFIPAGAGNTAKEQGIGAILAVYPRWRGEHLKLKLSCRLAFGLSPLARGTHNVATEQMEQQRFIPAGAGNTVRTRTAL